MKRLLVVVDYQNDFVNGALGFEGAQKLENGIYSLVQKHLADGGYVLFTKDTHEKDYLNTREGKYLPAEHCIKGTNGHALYASLAEFESGNNSRAMIIEKKTFGSDTIAEEVKKLCGGEPNIIEICGVVTNICVLCNAVILHTNFLNSEIIIHSKLCAAMGDNHQKALDIMAGLGMKII